MANPKDFENDIIAIAEQAGRVVMEIYTAHDFTIHTKDDGSPLTAADLASDQVIAAGLTRIDPRTPILSEECVPTSGQLDWNTFWCVDPLDGTKEFISRSGEFTINIALIAGGIPILGVVHAPAQAEAPTWWGGVSVGGSWCRRNTGPAIAIRCAAQPTANERLRIVASKSHRDADTDAWIADLDRPVDLVSAGSSLKLCLVAEGTAHAYPRFGPTNAWDTAAGHAVLLGAGARVLQTDGTPLTYNPRAPLNPAFIAGVPGFITGCP